MKDLILFIALWLIGRISRIEMGGLMKRYGESIINYEIKKKKTNKEKFNINLE